MLDLVDLILCLPSSSSECERGFSLMKHIKTDFRNKMKCSTLSDLMRVHLHSDPIETFDPTDAISDWYKVSAEAKRKPLYNVAKPALLASSIEDAEAMAASTSTATASTTGTNATQPLNSDLPGPDGLDEVDSSDVDSVLTDTDCTFSDFESDFSEIAD